MDRQLGTLETVDGRRVLRFERRLAHPPEKVWRVVTDPAEMTHWFPAVMHTDPAVGAPIRFTFPDDPGFDGPFTKGRVLEYDPPKVYAFTWHDSVLRFELASDGAGCLLVFTYTMSDEGTWDDRPAMARTAPGWDVCLDTLATRLDGAPDPQVDRAWILDRAERYVEAFGLGEGTTHPTPDGHLVRFERDLTQPPHEVWATLTEGTEPTAGQAPPPRATHGYLTPGPVTEASPGTALEYTWLDDDAPAGRVRFELRHQDPIGTRLVVTQTLPSHLADRRATALAAWQTHLELFFAALHGDIRCPWPTERTDHLERAYRARLTTS
ncbi:SRPBCC family protein [Actinomadura kijaniata]|uniref:SRPBCC family protein n=1 Tax=Actinomadura kijaniata TaxID=46161 RepID=UPI00083601F6|nr:SRPBCC family protein [Actinomadura kijaniata]